MCTNCKLKLGPLYITKTDDTEYCLKVYVIEDRQDSLLKVSNIEKLKKPNAILKEFFMCDNSQSITIQLSDLDLCGFRTKLITAKQEFNFSSCWNGDEPFLQKR